ncbi:MAG: tRNA lysidine(34) synthetase TilS [Bacteroidales bacterium]|nr:tRNA lysidine(34) synthetase TilS [Bacteroidales bacterium]
MDPERSLLSKVESFIKEKKMFTKEAPIIVGLSGGADSVALLDVLSTLGYNCIAAHCNFHLRGEESARDHEFSRMQAKNHSAKFEEINFDAKAYALENGLSIEMACRELRYEWFYKLIDKYMAQSIAIAHHLDDSIETFFLNLLRGTGIAGLSGINAVNDKVVRPFLCLGRKEIEDYLSFRNIDFITDSTNLQDIYTRNKVRLQLIPLLKSINPNACESVVKTINNLQMTERIYINAIKNSIENITRNDGENLIIDIPKLLNESDPKAVIFEILKNYGISSKMIDDIFSSLYAISGKLFYSKDYRVIKDRDKIIVTKRSVNETQETFLINEDTFRIDYPVEMIFESFDNFPDFKAPSDPNTACFDTDILSFPLIMRHWILGDKFSPFGMKGMKKISDYFSDHKFSISDKEKTWLLVSDDNIIWIVGERSDNRYRVTPKTKHILMVTLK